MDPRYPLFFAAEEVLEVQARNKIRRYFRIRRDSGGGDCGDIEQIAEKLYKISFELEEDQERVLTRKTHTISLPSGHLHLTVSRTEQEARGLQQTPSQVSSKPPKARNCLPTDDFFLTFLHDRSDTFKHLQKLFTCVGCTAELDFDRRVVVVRADEAKGLVGTFSHVPENWEVKVDRVWRSFQESYTCHHEVDRTVIKSILQDKDFAGDDVKVYTEFGYIVVVGEASVVSKKIQNVTKKTPTKTELSVDERQFSLIEDEFTREMRTNLPNVKTVIRNNVVAFEGLNAEVQSGLALCDELLKRIQQKHVQFSPELQSFFTTGDAIAKYKTRFKQCLRNPVSLETSAGDLVLSSLSAEAVDEAAAILERDFSTALVHLEGSAAVPPDLDQIKELIMKGKIDVNARERRLDVSLVPGPNSTVEVQLAGYSDSVNKLKEEIQDYLLNCVTVGDTLILSSTEMVEHFDKILTIIAPKDSRVSMNASSAPGPCVTLSGPKQIVLQTLLELTRELRSLVSDTLVLDGPGASQYFNAEGKASKELIESSNQVFIQEMEAEVEYEYVEPTNQPVLSDDEDEDEDEDEDAPGASSVVETQAPVSNISVKIKLGSLVDEQVNVLVVPMLKKKLVSTQIGKSLLKKGGLQMKMKFGRTGKRSLKPGEVLEVTAPASLGCSKLFFIECLPWDGLGGPSVKALRSGLRRCLELCVEQGHSSVALPMIGHGKALKYPLKEAVLLLTEELNQFGRTSSVPSTVKTIHIVIKPDKDVVEEIYHEVHRQLTMNMNPGGQAVFESVCSELNDVCISVGNKIQLELIFGDITNETTDAVVNSTNFKNLNTDVCKDILAVAGPEVVAELQSAKLGEEEVFVTQPGQFPCKALFHVAGLCDAGIIQQLMGSIVENCEAYEWTSVALPAICAGAGGLSAGAVAGAMLGGLKEALSLPLLALVRVRVVLNKINVFLAFKEESIQMFSTVVIQRVANCPAFHPPPPPVPEPALPPPPPAPVISDLPMLFTSSSNQNSSFKITGLSQTNVSNAMTKMKEVYQSQISYQRFRKAELDALTPRDFSTLKAEVESLGLQVDSSEDYWTVSGLTVKVNQLMNLVQSFMYGTLTREKRKRDEDELYRRVVWCIRGLDGEWERLPKEANYQLEHKEIEDGILDAQGAEWKVNLQNTVVTNNLLSEKALKRLENRADFIFPLYWDNMTADEKVKVVHLLPSSAEYQKVKEGFQQTCPKTVLEIERVQNIHLRRSYEAQLKHISDKNKLTGANEQLLYHGTTQENAKSIMNTGFDRRFSGQNATSYGQGSYFAVDASYAAHPTYSKPAADGTQLVFLARVLTGRYTLGTKEMRVPPPLDPFNPHERFDSVVDHMTQPYMFVVFHDNQACPDYLISFR